VRDDKTLLLEHGKPLVFGKERRKGLRWNGASIEAVELTDGVKESELLVHDEKAEQSCLSYYLAKLGEPDFPVPLGVFRAVERPTYEGLVEEQVVEAKKKPGATDLQALIDAGDTWIVE
jgi:2-oxoglutarate ferredoxin oxidoreductase subunit beta